jgi:hypothetical protein
MDELSLLLVLVMTVLTLLYGATYHNNHNLFKQITKPFLVILALFTWLCLASYLMLYIGDVPFMPWVMSFLVLVGLAFILSYAWKLWSSLFDLLPEPTLDEPPPPSNNGNGGDDGDEDGDNDRGPRNNCNNIPATSLPRVEPNHSLDQTPPAAATPLPFSSSVYGTSRPFYPHADVIATPLPVFAYAPANDLTPPSTPPPYESPFDSNVLSPYDEMGWQAKAIAAVKEKAILQEQNRELRKKIDGMEASRDECMRHAHCQLETKNIKLENKNTKLEEENIELNEKFATKVCLVDLPLVLSSNALYQLRPCFFCTQHSVWLT